MDGDTRLMTDPKGCPSPETLRDFHLGGVSEAEFKFIAFHLDICASCSTRFSSLEDGDDELVRLLRTKSPDSNVPESVLRLLLDRMKILGKIPHPADANEAIPEDAADARVRADLAGQSRYTNFKKIGRGGMGVVYLAWQQNICRRVVLKVISESLASNPEMAARFQNEIKAIGRLDHDNIVRIFDADYVGKTLFLVMEFVRGSDLLHLIRPEWPLSADRACDYARQVTRALHHAHENSIIHRDIKPSNLIVTPVGKVKVLDFGLAKLLDEATTHGGLTATNQMLGTLHYMAPEQAVASNRADIRADIYSLGCTLYHMLAGHRPFPEARTSAELIRAHADEKPRPLTEIRGDIPPSLSTVVERMMAKAPEDRYQTPAGVEQALTEIVERISVSTPFTPPYTQAATALQDDLAWEMGKSKRPRDTWLRTRRERSVLTLAAVVLMAALIGLGWFFRSSISQARPELGTLAVALEDPRIATEFRGEELRLFDPATGLTSLIAIGPQAKQRLHSGVYVLSAADGSRLRIDPDRFTIGRDGVQVVRLSLANSSAPPTGQVFTNSIGMKLVRIPAGEFLMGTAEPIKDLKFQLGDFAFIDAEYPQHKVRITRPYYLGMYEVTVGQFRKFVENQKYRTEAERDGNGKGWDPSVPEQVNTSSSYHWKDPGFLQTDDHPVVIVTWNDAKAFCAWLSEHEGRDYRLPTEAEWEFACRAGTTTRYFSGDSPDSLVGYGNLDDNSSKKLRASSHNFSTDDHYIFTAPVGTFRPNPFGVFDMAGNVFEWCEDSLGDYEARERTDPKGPDDSSKRVLRGGSRTVDARSAYREPNPVSTQQWNLGFRVVLALTPDPERGKP